jgi:hypothetical protein
LGDTISLVIPGPEAAAKIKTVEDARRVIDRAESVLLIRGRARLRKERGQSYHVLDLNSMVRHERVDDEVKGLLSAEMGRLLGGRRKISTENGCYVNLALPNRRGMAQDIVGDSAVGPNIKRRFCSVGQSLSTS